MKKTLLFSQLGLFLSLFILLSSCNTEFSGFEMSSSGLYYKFHEQNDTLKPQIGDKMTLSLKYSIRDSVIWNSAQMPESYSQILYKSEYSGDIYEALSMMSIGDSASFITSADSFFIVTAQVPIPEFVKETKKLFFDVKLIDIKPKDIVINELIENEAKQIKAYLEKNELNIKPENNGIYYITNTEGKGKAVEKGQIAQLNFMLKALDDRIIHTSYRTDNTLDYEYGAEPETEKTKFNSHTEGIDFVLSKMKEGGKATFIVPSDLGYGNEWYQRIAPYSPLLYEIEVVAIRDKDEYEQEKALIAEIKKKAEADSIQKYLGDNNINIEPTESGLYFIEIEKGIGGRPVSGDKVKVHYTFTLLNGKKLDSTHDRKQTYNFVVDKDEVFEGWHEGIKLMRKGSKAKLLIPSEIGYKDQWISSDILPYTPLLFEVELVEIL